MLIAVIITSITNASAGSSQMVSKISVKNTDEINLKLNLGDVTNMSEMEIESKINKFLTKNIPKNSELQCSLTLKASVDVGVADVGIEITVSEDTRVIRTLFVFISCVMLSTLALNSRESKL